MRRIVALVIATSAMLAASIAAADSAVAKPDGLRYAIAVNSPTSWAQNRAYAASGYVGIAKHHAIRANLATYDYSSLGPEIIAALGSNSIETRYSGDIQDVAIGWQAYSRGLFDGLTFSVDALVRRADTTRIEYWNERTRDTQSVTYAGRVMIGWSWLFQKRAFVAVQVGFSKGLERGTEDVHREDYDTGMTITTTAKLDRETEAAEGFVRFGIAFGRD